MSLKHLFNNYVPDPSKQDGAYRDSLKSTAEKATKMTSLFFSIFALVYWLGGYPPLAVWVNLGAILLSMAALLIITRYGKYRLGAYLLTFAIYISSTGVMAISNGIHSSSVIWQVFIPVAAFMMTGLRAGLRWGGVSLLTILGFYLLDTTGLLAHVSGFETTTFDLLFDLCGATLAISIVIWYSDRLKSRSIMQLEETQARLNYFATTDTLTNISNRRHFIEQSKKKIQRIATEKGDASLLLFDIDNFKQINDQYGHVIGDQILTGIAQTCLQYIRPDDILGRFGGDEFVILLPNTAINDASNIAERLRVLIENTTIETDIGPQRSTISVGVSVMKQTDNPSVHQLLLRADRAMYQAKQSEKNQVVVWDSAKK